MATTLEERTKNWREWWEDHDFSWEGLAKKPWQNWWVGTDGSISAHKRDNADRSATLQDYWRAEEHRLTEGPLGKSYTRFHLPLTWRNGQPTGKSEWDIGQRQSLIDELYRRLTEASSRAIPDGRAQFNGVVVPGDLNVMAWAKATEGEPPPVNVIGELMWIDGNLDLEHCRIGACDLSGSVINGWTWLESCVFEGEIEFVKATLGGVLRARNAVFKRNVAFAGAWFLGDAEFSDAEFQGDAHFGQATFCEMADFTRVKCKKIAYFHQSRFEKIAGFTRLEVTERAWFSEIVFNRDAFFREALFNGIAHFSWSRFRDNAWFERACFTEVFRFHEAVFERAARFTDVKYPKKPSQFSSAFYFTRFKEPANFQRANFVLFAAFNEALFECPPLMGDDRGRSDSLFSVALRRIDEEVKDDARALRKSGDFDITGRPKAVDGRQELPGGDIEDMVTVDATSIGQMSKEHRESLLAALEGGCRTLKSQMELKRARALEQRFYRYELIARRHRPFSSPGDKIASGLFQAIAEFGDDFMRPVWVLTALTVLFGFIYWGWAEAAGLGAARASGALIDPNLVEAFGFSGRNVFRPFGVWTVEKDVLGDWLDALLKSGQGLGGLAVRILASLQSILSLTLAFLVGLALRRKFQIN